MYLESVRFRTLIFVIQIYFYCSQVALQQLEHFIKIRQSNLSKMMHQKLTVMKNQNTTLKTLTFSPSNEEKSTNQSRTLFNPKKYLKPALMEEEVKQIKQIFDIFDSEGRGLINPQELIEALNSAGYQGRQNAVYQQLVDLAADGQGEVQFEKFLTMMTTKVTEHDSQSDMKQLFSLFDDQKCGYVTIRNLRRSTKQLGIDIDEEQLQRMIEVADFNKDGRVSEEDFYVFMTGKKDQ